MQIKNPSEMEDISKLTETSKIDPTQFDVTISSLLIGLGADKYVDIFKTKNIGQTTLLELADEDLIKLGVDDVIIRKKIIDEAKNLPIYEETSTQVTNCESNLGPLEIVEILEESSQHLYRIYLSMLASTLAIKKTKKITDSLLHEDKYASDIALCTLSEITNIINSMDVTMHTQMKMLTQDSSKNRKNKMIVGTMGGAVIVVLAIFFARSLKQLK